ncbi:HD-GYP domain-containing protein [Paenibacillus prosopidis]|uniref:HD-GYP domain-containing protein (C-di-GMP phosphodiesterase class II) n=1 Tax=Paenibacillus prosopidis TaxID=630520 RepID=A0A368VPD1_9BACL|nr:HD-GYP domain-containing protein [Paenibacillus prosopidis]RCW43380.1 HD-GYP domain-containing protein (c-di-GMP phosphodiesterase class II) [Paenibacillus prosopidis]
MRLLPIAECRPGMKLAKKIFSQEGLALLGENIELTVRLISRLEQCGIQYVYIADPRTDDIVLPTLISEDTMRVALKEIRTSFREMMDRPKRKKGVTYPYIAQPFKQMMNMIIDDLSGHHDAMIMLMNMGSVDHYLYQHSLNVCVYSTLLGMSNGYSRDELTTLGMGALLHDIGKTQISIDVLRKPGSLTTEEYEAMKQHARIGYELLKDEPNLPLLVAHCAFQHHERIDGSGYPRGIRGNEIHDYAKWIGLVDSYDAMTTNRVYSAPMLPHHAIERLYAGTGTLYEQRMVQVFRDKVAIYPIGITVRLQTGESGIVVDLNHAYPHRPIIRILYNEAGEEIAMPFEIDLSKHLTVMIVGVNDSYAKVQQASGI